MDEAEGMKKGSEKFEEMLPLLNSGWERTGYAVRVEGKSGKRKRVTYSTFSPKIICAINPVFETLRDRTYLITLIKTMDETRGNLGVREKDPVWKEIRDSLYLMLFEYYQEVLDLSESDIIENDLKLIGRDWDKAKPIVTLAQFISKYAGDEGEQIRKEIIEFLTQQRQEEEESASDSIEATIVQVLEEKINEGLERLLPERRTDQSLVTIQLNDFAMQVANLEGLDTSASRFNKKSYNRKIAGKLKNMGLRRNARVTHGNFAIFDRSLSDIQLARQRYKIVSEAETNHTILTNYTNQTNLANHYTNYQKDAENREHVSMVSVVSQKEAERVPHDLGSGQDQNNPIGKPAEHNEKLMSGIGLASSTPYYRSKASDLRLKQVILEGVDFFRSESAPVEKSKLYSWLIDNRKVDPRDVPREYFSEMYDELAKRGMFGSAK